ncbi:ComF family protein [Uliginosibacterium sp. sgz301328]|uniref:ComF family protein n=1 Tax=Uliginosibacterium sp. sgz301328 TaxID=3243764 RepID=UPI00359F01AA
MQSLIPCLHQVFAQIWPARCHVCGARSGLAPVCEACMADLPQLPDQRCALCGLPTLRGATCGRCLHRLPHFDATHAAFVYAFPVRELLLSLKAGHGFELAGWFATRMAQAWPDEQVDAIVAMPLHPRRLRERGFNQSMELARRIGQAVGVPVWIRAVDRARDTPHQTGLRLRGRRNNLRGAFVCTRRFDGLHVVVVDDVMTSGTSCDELARTLKRAGARRVTCLVTARTLAAKRVKVL